MPQSTLSAVEYFISRELLNRLASEVLLLVPTKEKKLLTI
jgi:hypothetical protein